MALSLIHQLHNTKFSVKKLERSLFTEKSLLCHVKDKQL